MPTAEITRKGALLSNFQDIGARISSAKARAGFPETDKSFIAVTKYADTGDVKILVESGAVTIAGESRVQDARSRWVNGPLAPLRPKVQLHFIGHLQSNKAKAAVETFDWIDCIDSARIAAEVNRHAAAAGRKVPVLIQLKLNAAPTQSGVAPEEAAELLKEMRAMTNIEPRGYMGIAPAGAGEAELRSVFADAKKIFDRDFPEPGNYLSLGMSGDYELAVEAGSNLPRIGSSLFA